MLKCNNLVKKYMQVTAVDGLNLEICPGKIYALLGPNGSGKSTLMKMIGGLTKPSSGSITLDGEPLNHKTKAKIAYMPTEAYFYNYMSCRDIGKYYQDFFRDFSYDKYIKLLADMDLKENLKAKEMSSGMMAKLKIAVTMARQAKVYLLDEPLNGIDLLARDQIMTSILEAVDDDVTLVISSHLVDELEKIVDTAIFIKESHLVAMCEAETLRMEEGKSIVDKYREIYGHGGEA